MDTSGKGDSDKGPWNSKPLRERDRQMKIRCSHQNEELIRLYESLMEDPDHLFAYTAYFLCGQKL